MGEELEAELTTWLDRVVMGVARVALATPPPARVVETVPVTVPRVVIPEGRQTDESGHIHR